MIRFLQCLMVMVLLAANCSYVNAAPISYAANLDGLSEVPPNNSAATGFFEVEFDVIAHALIVQGTFSGLTSIATAAHIHAPALPGTNIGVAVGFPGFPNALSGTYSFSFDTSLASTFTSSFITNFGGGTVAGAEAALDAALAAGEAYVNIHNAVFPGGEIRGQLSAVPEPASILLLGTGLLGAALFRRRINTAGRRRT